MVAPYSTVGGYGANGSLVATPTGLSAVLSDEVDGYPVLYPQISTGGGLSAVVFDSAVVAPGSGMPEINAILIELRVIAALLHSQLGSTNLDLQQMRADEVWNINIATGVL